MKAGGARFALALAASLTAAAPARPATPSLAEMLSDLQRVQTQVAAGDKVSYTVQRSQLRLIAAAIAQAKPETWRSKRETDALVLYVLSGGPPRAAALVVESGAIPKSEEPLLRGALEYVLGREKEARALLGDVNPRTLDLPVAGQVAFAISMLVAKRDPGKAIAMLDLARLLAPGALVEEAALRREVLLLAEQRDVERLVMLARQYFERFGASLYAEQFLRDFVDTVARDRLADDAKAFQGVLRLASFLSPQRRVDFLLAIARDGLVNAQFDVAASAATEALRDTRAGSPEEARGQLYRAAARVMGDSYQDAAAALQALAAAKLDKRDAALLAAAREVSAQLRAPPGADAPGPRAAPAGDAASATIALAEATLERTQALSAPVEMGKP
jgi:chemotaxis protein MotC